MGEPDPKVIRALKGRAGRQEAIAEAKASKPKPKAKRSRRKKT